MLSTCTTYAFPCDFQNVTSAIISSCANFFSVMLPSSSLLILDFIQATNGVVNSQNMEVNITIHLKSGSENDHRHDFH